ncbi:MAG TPA: hypothetical protein VL970_09525, partial [Candidatus Acidoferrales bacterium]|nr:hypothetical protein [Candidatus Acidoferrales bacterium]
YDAVPGQYIFIIQPELIGQKSRGQVIVGFPQNRRGSRFRGGRTLLRVMEKERSIDPTISARAILHPNQDIFQSIEKLGQLKGLLIGCHSGMAGLWRPKGAS